MVTVGEQERTTVIVYIDHGHVVSIMRGVLVADALQGYVVVVVTMAVAI